VRNRDPSPTTPRFYSNGSEIRIADRASGFGRNHHPRGGDSNHLCSKRRRSPSWKSWRVRTQSGTWGNVQKVRIRGGDVRHTLVLIGGIRANDPSSTGNDFDFSLINLQDVERIEVLRGPNLLSTAQTPWGA
jgi:hypothetical protein